MIAMKREVAAGKKLTAGFPWSECQVRKLTASHCTNLSLSHDRNDVRDERRKTDVPRVMSLKKKALRKGLGHTRESVQSPLVRT